MAADQYLEPAEVAKLLKRPVNWLAKMRMTSEGPAFIKCGRKILYRRSTIESWLAAAERRSTRKAA